MKVYCITNLGECSGVLVVVADCMSLKYNVIYRKWYIRDVTKGILVSRGT